MHQYTLNDKQDAADPSIGKIPVEEEKWKESMVLTVDDCILSPDEILCLQLPHDIDEEDEAFVSTESWSKKRPRGSFMDAHMPGKRNKRCSVDGRVRSIGLNRKTNVRRC